VGVVGGDAQPTAESAFGQELSDLFGGVLVECGWADVFEEDLAVGVVGWADG
jgi:hypothetical protein